jgi:hypothetical protein
MITQDDSAVANRNQNSSAKTKSGGGNLGTNRFQQMRSFKGGYAYNGGEAPQMTAPPVKLPRTGIDQVFSADRPRFIETHREFERVASVNVSQVNFGRPLSEPAPCPGDNAPGLQYQPFSGRKDGDRNLAHLTGYHLPEILVKMLLKAFCGARYLFGQSEWPSSDLVPQIVLNDVRARTIVAFGAGGVQASRPLLFVC